MSNPQMRYKCEVPADVNGSVLRLEVYDYIDSFGGPWGVSAREVIAELGAEGIERIDVNIHSRGGDLFEALAIYNRLRSHKAPVHVYIDGLAASAASLIAMAGDVITMPTNAWLMIHQPWTIAAGNASDFREQADMLDRNTDMLVGIYAERSGMPEDQVREWVTAETWFDGDQAYEAGLIDMTAKPAKLAASASLGVFTNPPAALVAAQHKEPPQMNDYNPAASLEDLRAACPGADAQFILDQVEAKATLQAAQTAHIETLTAKIENRETEIQELKAKHEQDLANAKEERDLAVETVELELGQQVSAAQKAREDAETALAQVKAGLDADESPSGDDATPDQPRKASAFAQAIKVHRN